MMQAFITYKVTCDQCGRRIIGYSAGALDPSPAPSEADDDVNAPKDLCLDCAENTEPAP